MKRWRGALTLGIMALCLYMPLSVEAAEEPEEILSANTSSNAGTSEAVKENFKSDTSRADDWFEKQDDEKEKGPLARLREKKQQQQNRMQADKKDRYVLLMNDNGFAYYLDRQNAKWKKIPYSESEDILDVWIRLVKTDDSGEYSYPPKYYLEHYYLRPKKQQVQFLSELEVTGRPNNAIKERSYSVRNWENLVPGSLEDEIYHKVMGYMKKDPFKEWFKGKSLRDEIEDKLRISI